MWVTMGNGFIRLPKEKIKTLLQTGKKCAMKYKENHRCFCLVLIPPSVLICRLFAICSDHAQLSLELTSITHHMKQLILELQALRPSDMDPDLLRFAMSDTEVPPKSAS